MGVIYDLIRESEGFNSVQARRKQESLNRASQVICISEETKRQLKAHYQVDDQRLHVVHLGVSNRFLLKKLEKTEEEKFFLWGKDQVTRTSSPLLKHSRYQSPG